jgi:hypothetical protein
MTILTHASSKPRPQPEKRQVHCSDATIVSGETATCVHARRKRIYDRGVSSFRHQRSTHAIAELSYAVGRQRSDAHESV